jgi:uncharacterized membrane protein YdfJ with MMPL/SSD domain
MFRLRWCPDLSVSSGPGRGERLSAWPVSCTGSVVCAPTARSWLSRSGSAVATSGGAIVFAGSTVIIALLSLVGRHLFGAKLPALLRPRARRGAVTLWSRWAATVTAHPLACGLVALALLVPLIVPMLSLHLGQEDIAATPKQTTERQAFDLLASRYGPGYNGPLLTATELSPPAHPSQEYEDKYNQAKANQADLERKQKTLTAKSNSLKSQQASLERQQADLLDQKRQLQQEQAQLLAQQASLQRQAARLESQQAALQRQLAPLERQERQLRAEQRQLQQRRVQLRRQANALSAQGAALRRQADELAAEGASLQRQADSLQRQADALKKQQQQAEEEKKQTEQLKQELTDELTKAGGDDRGTDPRLVKLQDALAKPAGVQLVSPPSINKRGDAATFTVIPNTRPADPKTADLVTEMRTSVSRPPPARAASPPTSVG